MVWESEEENGASELDIAQEEDNQHRTEPQWCHRLGTEKAQAQMGSHRPPPQKQRFIHKWMWPASEGRQWSWARWIEMGAGNVIMDLPELGALAKLVTWLGLNSLTCTGKYSQLIPFLPFLHSKTLWLLISLMANHSKQQDNNPEISNVMTVTRGSAQLTQKTVTNKELEQIQNSTEAHFYLEKTQLIVPPGQEPMIGLLATAIHHVINYKLPKPATNALRAITFLMNELEETAIHQTVWDLVMTQFNEMGTDLKDFVTDAMRWIDKHIESKMLEISMATKTLVDSVKWLSPWQIPMQPKPPLNSITSKHLRSPHLMSILSWQQRKG